MLKNQGTSLPVASQQVNGDMAKEWEELVELDDVLVELDDVQLATVVGGQRFGGTAKDLIWQILVVDVPAKEKILDELEKLTDIIISLQIQI